MKRPLTNTFGFASNCFVCEPTNQHGLRIPFVHDDERDVVEATITFDDCHSGAPQLVHGGLLALVCDEAMAWAAIALAGRFALIAEARYAYATPLPVGTETLVTARVIGQHRKQLWLMADVRCGDTVHARGEARARILSDELATAAGVIAGAGGGLPSAPPT
ncbi:MAG TPA: hotdog domain-containing protein [Candidatus Dormibacteraeota bacterium]|jgi:acyl-coenzyme A thioesterase PaaI-like protein|nr:hotdog domain-containing protein [Candidatus Dormibacteraeota bacterium]